VGPSKMNREEILQGAAEPPPGWSPAAFSAPSIAAGSWLPQQGPFAGQAGPPRHTQNREHVRHSAPNYGGDMDPHTSSSTLMRPTPPNQAPASTFFASRNLPTARGSLAARAIWAAGDAVGHDGAVYRPSRGSYREAGGPLQRERGRSTDKGGERGIIRTSRRAASLPRKTLRFSSPISRHQSSPASPPSERCHPALASTSHSISTLEVTQGQILSQSPTDATRFWWHMYGG